MIRPLLLMIGVLVLSGCGLTLEQKHHVKQFAQATEVVSTTTVDQFTTTHDAVIELERRILIMDNKRPPKHLDLDGGLNVEGLTIRIATVNALGEYGAILYALASDAQAEHIADTMSVFLNDLEVVAQANNKTIIAREEQRSVLAGIISMAAAWSLEKEKKKHVKTIVTTFNPSIRYLANVLKNDIVLKESSKCIKKQNRVSTREIKTGVIDHYCKSLSEALITAKFKLTNKGLRFDERAFAYDSYVLALQAREEIRLMSEQGQKTIDYLVKANEALLTVVNDGSVKKEDIKAFAKHMGKLKDMVKILAKK